MARRTAFLACTVTLIAGTAFIAVADNAAGGSGASKARQTSVRGAASGEKVAVKASGDEATAPKKSAGGAAAKAGTAQQTKAVGETTEFVENGPST